MAGDDAAFSWGADLATSLVRVAETHDARVALRVGADHYTYGALFRRARAIASLLVDAAPSGGEPRGAVMGTRTVHGFAGVLGTLLAGAAYVPLGPKFPLERTLHMLRASRSASLVIEEGDLRALAPNLAALESLKLVIVPDAEDVSALQALVPRQRVCGKADLDGAPARAVPETSSSALAYVMFTSGSTGQPKGVMVTNGNVLSCLGFLGKRYGITSEDRFSQNFELTFDLSVFDMFLCWLHGAMLCVAPPALQACPAPFVVDAGLTVWFSVPSMGLFMSQMRALKPNAFPSLRWSLFCGERLTQHVAGAWAKAAPASHVENLYGPTEVTIACTLHRFDDAPMDDAHGAVPIGAPFDGLRAAVVGADNAQVADGEIGELCMDGPQVARGYLDDPEKTAERFVSMPWDPAQGRWYRTGDLVSRRGGVLVHLGRSDDQVKIRGFRIELGEVEFGLRRALGIEAVSVLAEPTRHGEMHELIAFAAGAPVPEATVREALGPLLPQYMHPARLIFLNALPLSSNGKTDKAALRRIYRESHAQPDGR